jgi:formylglycine-generating enzyme required for sulfatase activity
VVEADKIDVKTRIEAADALGQVGDARLERDNWVTIPAGTFRMGAQKTDRNGLNYDPEAGDRGAPVHEVVLKRFRIGQFPVTVQEFAEFIKDDGYKVKKHWTAGGFGDSTEPKDWEGQQQHLNRPVVSVSWFEASAYCAWKGGRLPTEAEWERSARGPSSCRYPWGNDPPLDAERANYAGSIGHPSPVGVYPKGNSTEGLCDMLGNVWEWCSDWFGEYPAKRVENPGGPGKGSGRVVRGGSWSISSVYVRVSNRFVYVATYRYFNVGFRCARE